MKTFLAVVAASALSIGSAMAEDPNNGPTISGGVQLNEAATDDIAAGIGEESKASQEIGNINSGTITGDVFLFGDVDQFLHAIARDTAIKKDLAQAGVEVLTSNGALLFEPWTVKTKTGEPFKVFTPFWRACRDMLTADWGYDRYPGVCHIIPNAGVTDVNMFTMTALIDQFGATEARTRFLANSTNGVLTQTYVDQILGQFDVIANSTDPLFNFEVTQPVNVNDARIYGFEAAIRDLVNV